MALENTGARPGELRNARVKDFDPVNGEIVYYGDDKRREDEFRHKTAGGNRDRAIVFTGAALEMVRELCKGKLPEAFIFPSFKGTKYSRRVLDNGFRYIADRHGWKHFVPNAYRHTSISRCLEAGKPVEQVAEAHGNSPATIYKHYSHLCRSRSTIQAMLEDVKRTNPCQA
jgi:integrase